MVNPYTKFGTTSTYRSRVGVVDGHIHGLAVVTVTASVEVHNQYDGIENVSVSWTVNGDKE